MSPEEINAKHGKPTWRCWGCKTETGLHWHHGWSVAVCDKPECGQAYDAVVAKQVAEEEAYREYVESIYGPQRWQ